MFSLIDRYVIREVLKTLIGVSIVLFLIFMSNRIVRYLAQVASGDLPSNILFSLIGLTSIQYMILMLPLSIYIAILLLLGRFYKDQEMAAMNSCGIGTLHLYRPIFWISGPLAILVALMTFYVIPWTSQIEVDLLKGARKNLVFTGISAGQFRESQGGKRIIYVEEMSDDHIHMRNIFVRILDGKHPVMVTAEQGKMEIDPETGNRLLVLTRGARYEGEPGIDEYKRIEFERHSLVIKPPSDNVDEARRLAITTQALIAASGPEELAELQWRLGIPISVLVLSLLGVPLARVKPRQGQYGKLFTALLVYILYVNLLALAKSWIARDIIPASLGMWWVHLLMLGLTLLVLIRQYGWQWLMKQFRGGSAV